MIPDKSYPIAYDLTTNLSSDLITLPHSSTMGFDTSLFLTQPVDDSLLCPICLGVFKKPRTACSNGHVYCEECLDRTKAAMGSSCPNCREMLLEPMPLNRTVIDIIDKMQLSCEFGKTPAHSGERQPSSRRRISENGAAIVPDNNETRTLCDWQGLVSEYRQHTINCDYRLVECPNSHCLKTLPFMLLTQHENFECKHRTITCNLCSQSVIFYLSDCHNRIECPERIVKCEWCNEEMRGKNLGHQSIVRKISFWTSAIEEHFTGHYEMCAKVPVKCEFSSVGCSARVARENIEKHHTDMAAKHVQLLHDAFHWEKKNVEWEIAPRHFTEREATSIESPKFVIGGLSFSILLHLSTASMKVRLLLNSPPRIGILVKVRMFRLNLVGLRITERSGFSDRSGNYYPHSERVSGSVPKLEEGFECTVPSNGGSSTYLTEWCQILFQSDENGADGQMTPQMVTDSLFDDSPPTINIEMEVKRPETVTLVST